MCEAILLILGVSALLGASTVCLRRVATSHREGTGTTQGFGRAARRVLRGEIAVLWDAAPPRSFPCRIDSAWQQGYSGKALSQKGRGDGIVFPRPSVTASFPTAQRFGMFCKPVSSGFGGFSLFSLSLVADCSETYMSISSGRPLLAV